VAAIMCGGMLAPVLFTFGLRSTTGATASLLLNLETVFTVALAWFIFREHRNPRVVIGMALIPVASVVLRWNNAGRPRLRWDAPDQCVLLHGALHRRCHCFCAARRATRRRVLDRLAAHGTRRGTASHRAACPRAHARAAGAQPSAPA